MPRRLLPIVQAPGGSLITDDERETLTRLLDADELFGLEGILEPDRAERLRWRVQRMLDLGVVLLKGVM
jgi:hypothetical protein